MAKILQESLADIPKNWRDILENKELVVICEALRNTSFTPPAKNIFEFAKLTPFNKIKVVIIGQDPYPRAGDAHGLAFSCLTNVPASLKNIYKCLAANKLIEEVPTEGNLDYWARQGVLLINRSLTTLVGKPNSHVELWDDYTKALVQKLSSMKPLIFMLWGNNARELTDYIDSKSIIYEWSHPSPLAQTHQKFINCPHFIDANKLLIKLGQEPIDWNTREPTSEVEQEFGVNATTQVVFTDGSCYPNRACAEAKGGYAASFALGTMKDTIIYGSIPNRPEFATNQRSEGMAILKVLEYLLEHKDEWDKCIIVSDSDFWIKMFEQYMPNWVLHDKFDEKKNPDLTKKMWEVYSTIIDEYLKVIQFRHMKSHGKDGWQNEAEGTYKYFCFINNKYVDELASYARNEMQPGEILITNASYDEE